MWPAWLLRGEQVGESPGPDRTSPTRTVVVCPGTERVRTRTGESVPGPNESVPGPKASGPGPSWEAHSWHAEW
eukprot:scaffold7092_cov262-Pinguiococcus_pyrenoidosus.AAC.9